jgi:Phage tail tube protein
MATSAILAGEASVAVNGTSYDLFGSLTYDPVTSIPETIKGQGGVFGIKSMPEPSKASMTLMDNGAMYVGAFNGLQGASLTFNLANGKSVVMSNCWQVGEISVNTVDGTFEIKFEGKSMIEIPIA